jgi:pyruvate,water dikinase
VVPLSELPVDVRRFGGKAVGLARLTAAGFPVPAGACISADGFRRRAAIALEPFGGRFSGLLDRSGRPDPERIEAARRNLRRVPLDPGLLDELADVLRRLDLDDRPVAVRSSGTFEDLSRWSAAGLQETVLGVTGLPDVAAAVERCHESVFRVSTFAYLLRAETPLDGIGLALVIQQQVRAESSGVLFTVNPVNGRETELVVNAVAGGGEDLVGGRRTPESLILDRGTLRVVRRQVPPEALGAVLSDDRARDLARLALRAERTLGCPVDVEWLFDAAAPDRIAVVQARPITAGGGTNGGGRGASRLALLPRRRVDPSRWVWTNANVGEALPGVATPFTWSVGLRFSRRGFEQAFATLGCAVPDDAVLVDRFRGRIYLNATEFLRVARQVPLLSPRRLETMAGVTGLGDLTADGSLAEHAGFVLRLPGTLARLGRANARLDARLDVFERRLANERARIERLRLGDLDPTGLLAEIEGRERWLDDTGTLMLTCAANSLSSHLALETLLRLWLPESADRLAGGLMAGFADLESAAPGLALWHISELVRVDGPSRRRIEETPPERLRPGDLDASGPTARALSAFLRAYGFRAVREAELATPRWAEDPTFLFATLRSYLGSEVGTPIARVERQKEARRAANEEVERSLGPYRFSLLRHVLHLAQKYTRLRERMRSRVTEVLGWFRAFAIEIGRRLGDPGAGFFLRLEDVRALLHGSLADAPAAAEENRRRYLADVAMPDPPPTFTGSPPPIVPVETPVGGLRGIPVSPGAAEGRARVLLDPAQAGELRPGEILVIPYADVGWAPLFLVSAAVVSGMGGTLSHAAVVAREYGVPAVFGIPGVTSRLRTGDRLQVDGLVGSVAVVDEPAS